MDDVNILRGDVPEGCTKDDKVTVSYPSRFFCPAEAYECGEILFRKVLPREFKTRIAPDLAPYLQGMDYEIDETLPRGSMLRTFDMERNKA
jgi:hypothetical protein